ncbi:hypothetical protein Poli38472_007239 [Pythium oligandrum]|uniref:Uncharacterized protein n=1 Tax=Pythium oligandrum TaxID=41045 RepID=A0A8K1C9B9_PYTOL|nr:hypothetical protein Poli38472_007239 [Pythium oligandrum]|eukprot:TMW59094.1 hypothetical protein Poli38472_007239 [Pythium oligandrum]
MLIKRLVLVLVHYWECAQTELHGQYSVERLLQVATYYQHTSRAWAMMVLILSALPCLVINVLLEAIPLKDPSLGLEHSGVFWVRACINLHTMAIMGLEQYRQLIPGLRSSLRQVTVMTTGMGLGLTVNGYALACWIGYPVPFFVVSSSLAYMTLLFMVVGVAWGRIIRENKDVRTQLLHCHAVVCVAFVLALAYPTYNYIFVRLSPAQQTWFTLCWPLMKLAAKNALSPMCKYIQDQEPEVVIFHVETFHALFISVCMQSATTLRTSAILIAMDFVHAWLSLRDISIVARHIERLQVKVLAQSKGTLQSLSDINTHVLYLVQADPALQTTGNIRVRTRWSSNGPKTSMERKSFIDLSTNPVVLSEPEKKLLLQALDSNEREQYVASVLKLLHMTEFVMLIEYTEVVVPVIYSSYLFIVFHLPNRIYNPYLRDISQATLYQTLANMLPYALLELMSLVLLQVLIARKLELSPMHQMAFVLEKQSGLIQIKLIAWFIFMIEFVQHFGTYEDSTNDESVALNVVSCGRRRLLLRHNVLVGD